MTEQINFKDIHWLVDMVENIDIGVVILDLDLNIKIWNSFMVHIHG